MTAALYRSRAPHRAPARPRIELHPMAALAMIGVGGAAVILLWLQDTVYVSGLGDWLTNAGRIAGLLAGYAIVVLLALMARIPALERGLGADRLARWHAMGGRYTVSLAVAHTLLIIWGYAVTAHTNVVHETTSLVLTYPDVLMGTVALLLFVGVAIASARAARRRLSYETWHFIHLYTYLALALAFSHQFSTGADFVSNTNARWLWSALYITVGALLLWYRLITPIRAAFRHQLRVVEVRRENADVVTVYITGQHLDELGAEAGQFFRWRFLTRELWWAANPYSLSAAPRPDMLRVTVKIAGSHSAALLALAPGTRILAEGPYGVFTASRRTHRKVLLLAGGVGITPLRALFETLPGHPGDITMIYRANTSDDLVLRQELDWIAR
ncbi:MAG: ferric reductase-like transmembrane domain-containing protein, partial [Jatrophihabitantaceae bacterium]